MHILVFIQTVFYLDYITLWETIDCIEIFQQSMFQNQWHRWYFARFTQMQLIYCIKNNIHNPIVLKATINRGFGVFVKIKDILADNHHHPSIHLSVCLSKILNVLRWGSKYERRVDFMIEIMINEFRCQKDSIRI